MKDARPSRCLAISLCCVFAVEAAGCYQWKTIPKPQDESGMEWEGRQVKLRQGHVVRIVDVTRLAYPRLEGTETDARGNPRSVVLDLRDFEEVQVFSSDPHKTALVVLGVVAGVALLVGLYYLTIIEIAAHEP